MVNAFTKQRALYKINNSPESFAVLVPDFHRLGFFKRLCTCRKFYMAAAALP